MDECKPLPLILTAPVLTLNAKSPPTPCTTLLVRPTTDVVSASFTGGQGRQREPSCLE